MEMIKTIYSRAFKVLMKKPLALWGISLMHGLLSVIVWVLCGCLPFLAIGVNLLLSTSMTMIFLHGYRGETVKSAQLFECFKNGKTAKHVLGGMLWMQLWICLWALIPIVGPIFAVIRTYEYRLTPYILVTEPEIPATEAFKVSSARTNGFKGKMFGAEVLVYVAIFVVSLVLGLLSAIPILGILFSLVSFVFNICTTVLTPLFMGLIQAAFYEEICVSVASVCPSCGAHVEPGSAFCAGCGQKQD